MGLKTGKLLKKYRDEAGFTQKSLGKYLEGGVTDSFIHIVEKGERNLTLDRGREIGKILKLPKDKLKLFLKTIAEERLPEKIRVILKEHIISPITGEVPSIESYHNREKRKKWAEDNNISDSVEIPSTYKGTSWVNIVIGNHLIQEGIGDKTRLIVFPPSPRFAKLTVLEDEDLAVIRFAPVDHHKKIFAAGKCFGVYTDDSETTETESGEIPVVKIRPKYIEFRCDKDKQKRSDLLNDILNYRDPAPASDKYDQDLTVILKEGDSAMGKIALAMKVFEEPE